MIFFHLKNSPTTRSWELLSLVYEAWTLPYCLNFNLILCVQVCTGVCICVKVFTVVNCGELCCTEVYYGILWCTAMYCRVQWCTVVYRALASHHKHKQAWKGTKQGEIQFSDGQTDRQTQGQVQVLSCTFVAKKNQAYGILQTWDHHHWMPVKYRDLIYVPHLISI